MRGIDAEQYVNPNETNGPYLESLAQQCSVVNKS